MRRTARILVVSLGAMCATAASGEAAFARGCIKGAILGGVIGHYAGRHGVLGAVAGCLYGRHHAHEEQRRDHYYGQHRPEHSTPTAPNGYNSLQNFRPPRAQS